MAQRKPRNLYPQPLDPSQPRSYFAVPQAFGSGSAEALKNLPADGRARDIRKAAVRQHLVVQSIRTLMASQGFNQAKLVDATKIPRRTLIRIFTGESWAQIHHLVTIGRVLGTDLFTVVRIEDLTFRKTWADVRQPQPKDEKGDTEGATRANAGSGGRTEGGDG